ncbi:MAG: hypothetical protein JST80_08190 [Bdellovibrionales bacterium]|nr:hypothetical protein [Bdellovibrionales bacterium]
MLTLKRLPAGFFILATFVGSLLGCSSAEIAPDKSVMPEVPDYVKVPHPLGYEIAEIRALFESPLAPKGGLTEFSDTCDSEFRMLIRATSIKSERRQGANELVTQSAEKMHWCFYGKVERMQDALKKESSWSARQRIVLDAYDFLTPIANAFLSVYHDSRYLRWATQYYSNISEQIFFRKVVPGPENTLALTTSASSDLETWTTANKKGDKKASVFTRYGIDLTGETPVEAGASAPPTDEQRAPASVQPTVPAVKEEPTEDVTKVAPDFPSEVKTVETPKSIPVMDTMETNPSFSKQIPDSKLAPIESEKPADEPAQVRTPATAPKPVTAKPVAPKPTAQAPTQRRPQSVPKHKPKIIDTPFAL